MLFNLELIPDEFVSNECVRPYRKAAAKVYNWLLKLKDERGTENLVTQINQGLCFAIDAAKKAGVITAEERDLLQVAIDGALAVRKNSVYLTHILRQAWPDILGYEIGTFAEDKGDLYEVENAFRRVFWLRELAGYF